MGFDYDRRDGDEYGTTDNLGGSKEAKQEPM